jgi:tetratricopeptide (TPR) repeat protein
MGGVGKTELAMRYAWQHLQGLGDGAGGVCWVDGRDGDVGIQLVNFARSLLNLNPPEDWDLPTQLKYCWRNWQPGDWLIVIDDVTNYRQQVNPYKPPESSQFKVLLTTREQLGRPVEHLPLDKLQPEAALDLLTSLVGVQRIQQESDIAEQLCDWLDYLPLGLELVGRYLERDPDLLLKTMLSRLEKKRLRHESVEEPDGTMTDPKGIADAFELSWERLDDDAQQLGCLLSLFASADIVWFLVKLAYSNRPFSEDGRIDTDLLEKARADLLRFNLLQRTDEGTYRLHQLIREFFREKQEQSAQVNEFKQALVAAIVVVGERLSSSLTSKEIQVVAPLMPHVAEVAKDRHLRKYLKDEDLTAPFVGLDKFYKAQGLYDQAQFWDEQCLSVTQACFGSNHPAVALSLNNLAMLYRLQGRYSEAEPLFLQALEINRELLGENHSLVAASLNNLATIYRLQGRYSEAEPLFLQALEINRELLGENHPNVAVILNNLADIYHIVERYSEAELLFLQALEINEHLPKEYHLQVVANVNSLAELYCSQQRYSEAEILHQEVLKLREGLLGKDHPNVAISLNNLANVYLHQQRYSEAESLYLRVLELRKLRMGEDHPNVAISLYNLATLYGFQKRYTESEQLLEKALEVFLLRLGAEHPKTVTCQYALATIRSILNSTARDLPNFNQKAKKSNSKKKLKGFGKA